MKLVKNFVLVTLVLLSYSAISQQLIPFINNRGNDISPVPVRTIHQESESEIEISYVFEGAYSKTIPEQDEVFQLLSIDGFSYLKDIGKPALPSHNDIIALPPGTHPVIKIIEVTYIEFNDYYIFPALPPAHDTYGADEPEFIIDRNFYNQDLTYPENLVSLEQQIEIKGLQAGIFRICPVQYNPQKRTLRVYSRIHYKIEFGSPSPIIPAIEYSETAKKLLPANFLNARTVRKQLKQADRNTKAMGAQVFSPNYLIITHSNYDAAAEKLAEWKSQLGYKVEIISASSWTSSDIKNTIHTKYQSYNPSPDYFVILGDHNEVPGEVLTSSMGSTFATDLYYACMGGSNDFFADIARGRISVSNSTEALNVVQKIIDYERTPIIDTAFYQTSMHAAYFQHAGSGYAERRFAQTSEELLRYMTDSIGFNVERVFYTESNVTPTNWNNGYYSNGEAIPSYLLKPGFPWDGDATDIKSGINEGRLYVLHRDHGFESGWGDPYYTTSNISQLTNGDKTPIVWSINCLTGKFLESECFSEKFLRHTPGGAVGVFGHAEVSYSGYNDALAMGCFDAIWDIPGFIPSFTGSGGISNPTLASHGTILTMGDVVNQSLTRMTETWGSNQYTNELFHYFGDPAMRIWTDIPVDITASNQDSIQCGSDTMLQINSCSVSDGLATFVVDGDLKGKVILTNGSGTIEFDPVAGNFGILTISKQNYRPYTDTIIITGGCPKADFTQNKTSTCIGDSITFTSQSSTNITSYLWNFGNGAIPATDTTAGPHTVVYTTSGTKTISLTVTNTNGNHTYSRDILIDQYCKFNVPASGSSIIDLCSGVLYDDGGTSDYSNSTDGYTTIAPAGASSITLTFNSFSFESGYDYLYVYDGTNTNSPLIGQYDGNTLPNSGTITSTGNSICIRQVTDVYVTESGFALNFQCNYPNTAPSSAFSVTDTASCVGEVAFIDQTVSGPVSWLWDFGDGNTSTQQHPVHQYQTNGTYTITLITANSFGSDTLVKNNYIQVNMPNAPVAQDNSRCGNGTVDLTASGSGVLCWFASAIGGTLIDTGQSFTTPVIAGTTTYYVEDEVKAPGQSAGMNDNTGGGSYFTAAYSHYLVFDCYTPTLLESVKVYAGSAGSRTIELRDASGTVIDSKTVFLTSGQQRITLDFDLPVGNNLQLAGPASPDLYRNNSGINYPYTLQNVLSIKYSSASSNPTGYYYYFYDWVVRGPSCISPRVPVTARVFDFKPTVDFEADIYGSGVQFADSSSDATSWYWDFGDGDTSSQQHPYHAYTAIGSYTVKLICYNDCGKDSLAKQIQITSLNIEDLGDFSAVKVFPNPAKNNLTLLFNAKDAHKGSLSMLNVVGEKVIQKEMDILSGENKHILNVSGLAEGIYYLRVQYADNYLIRKIIIAH